MSDFPGVPMPTSSPIATAATNTASGSPMSESLGMPPDLLRQMMGAMGGGVPNIPMTTMGPQMQQPVPQARVQERPLPNNQPIANTASAVKRSNQQNAIGSIANMVGMALEQHEAKKQREFQVDFGRFFEAQAGLQEAQQIAQDPNAAPEQKAQAKQAIEQNTQIMKDILGDPKKVKMFEKAFNINLIGEDKNANSNERKAMLKAYQEWRKKGAKGDSPLSQGALGNFNRQMPIQQGVNPQLQAMASAIKAGLIPSADKRAEVQGTMMKQVLDNIGRNQVEAMRSDAQKFGKIMEYYKGMDEEVQKGLNKTQELLLKAETTFSNKDVKTQFVQLKDLSGSVKENLAEKTKELAAVQKKLKEFDDHSDLYGKGAKHLEEKNQTWAQAWYLQREVQRLSTVNTVIERQMEGLVRGGANVGSTNDSSSGNGAGESNGQSTPTSSTDKGTVSPTPAAPAPDDRRRFEGVDDTGHSLINLYNDFIAPAFGGKRIGNGTL